MSNSSLALSTSFVNNSRPLTTISFPGNSYVISIAALPSHYAAAASTPSNAIYLLDKANPCTVIRSLPGHAEGISYMRSVQLLQSARDVLLSCGKDGTVKSWDERSGTVGTQMKSAGRGVQLLCCDASSDESLVAAGTVLQGEDASILYWDPRNPAAPLRQHTSTHSDDITAVHFSRRGSSTVLLSASTDGLLCTSNPYEDDEDDANLDVINWGCSISKAGWLPRGSRTNNSPSVWAASDMETFSLWSDKLDRIEEINRDTLTQPDPALPWVTDYIIDCHISRDNSFHIFAGSNEGDIALISPHESTRRWSLEQLYTRGHSEVVRCAHWDESSGLLLTGGEDAELNVWSSPVHFDPGNDDQSKPMDIDPDSPSRKRGLASDEQNEQKRVRAG